MDLNEQFHKEFDTLAQTGNELSKEIHDIMVRIQETPPLTDLSVCDKLEQEYFDLFKYASVQASGYLKLSQLYHYVKIVNQAYWDEQKKEE